MINLQEKTTLLNVLQSGEIDLQGSIYIGI